MTDWAGDKCSCSGNYLLRICFEWIVSVVDQLECRARLVPPITYDKVICHRGKHHDDVQPSTSSRSLSGAQLQENPEDPYIRIHNSTRQQASSLRKRSACLRDASALKIESSRAGVVQWQYRSFPSFGRGFDSHRPLQSSFPLMT